MHMILSYLVIVSSYQKLLDLRVRKGMHSLMQMKNLERIQIRVKNSEKGVEYSNI